MWVNDSQKGLSRLSFQQVAQLLQALQDVHRHEVVNIGSAVRIPRVSGSYFLEPSRGLGHGGFEEVGAGLIERTEAADLAGSHVGVGLQLGDFETLALNGAGRFDPLPDFLAGLAGPLVAQLFKRDARDFDARSVSIRSSNGPDIFSLAGSS
jgi:hypothetical protein